MLRFFQAEILAIVKYSRRGYQGSYKKQGIYVFSDSQPALKSVPAGSGMYKLLAWDSLARIGIVLGFWTLWNRRKRRGVRARQYRGHSNPLGEIYGLCIQVREWQNGTKWVVDQLIQSPWDNIPVQDYTQSCKPSYTTKLNRSSRFRKS